MTIIVEKCDVLVISACIGQPVVLPPEYGHEMIICPNDNSCTRITEVHQWDGVEKQSE